jgi:hypothetical protein
MVSRSRGVERRDQGLTEKYGGVQVRLSNEGEKYLVELSEFILSIGSSTEGPPRKSGGPLQFASARARWRKSRNMVMGRMSAFEADIALTCGNVRF